MPNYILKNENAILFEAGYSCDNALFLQIGGNSYFITDARYEIEAREKAKKNVKILCANNGQSLGSVARKLIRVSKIKKIQYDPFNFSVAEFDDLSKGMKIYFKKVANLSHQKRICKSDDEIKKLKNAATIGAQCFDEFAEYLRKNGEGKTEKFLQKIAIDIFSDNGNRELSFSPIFAINENAAKAHALPSDQKVLKSGDLILLDAGVRIDGYCSDRTRTASFTKDLNFSKEQIFKDQKIQNVYNIVLKAQQKAIMSVKPNIKAYQIDQIARQIITQAGYEKHFFHSTGHGVGLDIHELPRISPKSDQVIKQSMVFSIEPGIYLEGEFGIRIEDVVCVKENSCEVL